MPALVDNYLMPIFVPYPQPQNMPTSSLLYTGQSRTKAIHSHSGSGIITDAPLDNQGLAQAFSPTDLVATALASCMLTVMGIKARDMGYTLEGTTAEVIKEMASAPRRIAAVTIHIRFANSAEENSRKILEATALHCPVAKSLHPDIQQDIQFYWPV
jgi:putative redox protein